MKLGVQKKHGLSVTIERACGRPQGGKKCRSSAVLEIGTENQDFLANLKWFTILVLCSDVFAVHSCPLLCLQRQIAKLACRLFYCWTLLGNNNMAKNLLVFTSSYGGTVVGVLPHGSVERR